MMMQTGSAALGMAVVAIGLAFSVQMAAAEEEAPPPGRELPEVSFAQLDQRGAAGERLDVVFLGGSLTWGANATDPQRTSYRPLVGKWLTERYPDAQVISHDAAIGGTGSRLGIFRLERDVLSHHPDLVVLDFTANDNIRTNDPESLASYEAIVRRIISEAGCPVMMVALPFKGDMAAEEVVFLRREAHRDIARAYGAGFADAVALMRGLYQSGELKLEEIWDTPADGAHPGDRGYELFAQAVQEEFEAAVADRRVARLPERPLHGDLYLQTHRQRITTAGPLPAGWSAAHASRVGAYFDMQPSRWLDDVALVQPGPVEPLVIRFTGTSVALFGESTPTSGHLRATLNGNVLQRGDRDIIDIGNMGRRLKGNVRNFEALATGLAAGVEHTLVIEPVLEDGQELRIESICVGGPGARVLTTPTTQTAE